MVAGVTFYLAESVPIKRLIKFADKENTAKVDVRTIHGILDDLLSQDAGG
jgi:hypothetical protein